MPSPRETNKRLIRQAIEANDKMMNITIQLAQILHSSNDELPTLYKAMLEGDDSVDFGRYGKVLLPLLAANYYGEMVDEALTMARQQI